MLKAELRGHARGLRVAGAREPLALFTAQAGDAALERRLRELGLRSQARGPLIVILPTPALAQALAARGERWARAGCAGECASCAAECAARIEECISTLALEEITGPRTYAEDSLTGYSRFDMPLAADRIELTDFEQYSEVEYEQWYSYDDGAALFSYERYPACDDDVDAVVELTTGMYESVDELSARRDDALTAQLGCPAYRVEYLAGEEDSRMQNVDVIALQADCALCFHVEVAADGYDALQQTVESWLSALSVAPATEAEGDAAA